MMLVTNISEIGIAFARLRYVIAAASVEKKVECLACALIVLAIDTWAASKSLHTATGQPFAAANR